MKSTLLALVLLLGVNASAWADRIKDLASVAAGRTNQLIGYGLVVGLQGTGDGSDVSFTAQSMKSMLSRMGVSLDGPLSDFEQSTSAGKTHESRNGSDLSLCAICSHGGHASFISRTEFTTILHSNINFSKRGKCMSLYGL